MFDIEAQTKTIVESVTIHLSGDDVELLADALPALHSAMHVLIDKAPLAPAAQATAPLKPVADLLEQLHAIRNGDGHAATLGIWPSHPSCDCILVAADPPADNPAQPSAADACTGAAGAGELATPPKKKRRRGGPSLKFSREQIQTLVDQDLHIDDMAHILGAHPSTINRSIRIYGIQRPRKRRPSNPQQQAGHRPPAPSHGQEPANG